VKIIAVDFGDSRTGIAVCDSMEMLAVPECVISEKNTERAVEKIAAEINRIKPGMVVIGLAVNMDGSEGYRASRCRAVAGMIESRVEIPVVLWDERVSTKAAGRYMDETNTMGQKRKQKIDAAAAAVILQGFLDFRRNQKK